MSKPSHRLNRENRPKKKRDRELKRAAEAVPIVFSFFDQDGELVEVVLNSGGDVEVVGHVCDLCHGPCARGTG